MNWTIELINLLAPRSVEHIAWHKCPTCKMEYQKYAMARHCEKGHETEHPRTYIPYSWTPPKKHSVVFIGKTRLCGACAAKAEGSDGLCEVQMEEPGTCDRCKRLIQDPPAPPIKIPTLAPSEKRDIARLSMSRKALIAQQARRVWEAQEGIGHTTNVPSVDSSSFVQCGPYRGHDGQGGIPRAESGYIRAEGEPVSCPTPSHTGKSE